MINPMPYHLIIVNSFCPSAIQSGIILAISSSYSSSSNSEQFIFQFPGPFNSFSNFPSSKEIASWSVRTAGIISVNSTKSLRLLDIRLLLAEFSVRTVNYGPSFFFRKKQGSIIYSTDRKNEANKMFIIWLLPVWGTGNKCRTHDLTVIWQVSKKKVFIGARKQ